MQAEATSADDPLEAEFAKAAADLKERLEEQNMVIEDKVLKCVLLPLNTSHESPYSSSA